jgi:hypothetical protein
MLSMIHGGALASLLAVLSQSPTAAQTADQMQHQHGGMQRDGWSITQDGVVFLTFNHQGGGRGGDELVSQNWWMGMAERPAAGGTLRFNLMLSLEPATLGEDGYREIFQIGETSNGHPLIDHQHPHDFLMQAARRSASRRLDPSRSCTGHPRSRTRPRRCRTICWIPRTSPWAC